MRLSRPNRTQGFVLGFFAFVWVSLVVILITVPEIYDQSLKVSGGNHRAFDLAFLAVISAFIALLVAGTIRHWRWTFWLILVAFIFGVLRVPASVLQLTGVLRAQGPVWYTLFQALIGLVQFAIGLAMLAGYRRNGVWGNY